MKAWYLRIFVMRRFHNSKCQFSFILEPPDSPWEEQTLNFLGLMMATALLTCTRRVKRCLSWGGLPREPGYSQSKSSPSNPYWRRNLMTEAMKVWRFSGVETMAVKLKDTKEGRVRPWWAQHLVVKSNSCISVSVLFTWTHSPDKSMLPGFSCPYFVITLWPSQGISTYLYLVIHPTSILLPSCTHCSEHLDTSAHCVLSPNSPPKFICPQRSLCLHEFLFASPKKWREGLYHSFQRLCFWNSLRACFEISVMWIESQEYLSKCKYIKQIVFYLILNF